MDFYSAVSMEGQAWRITPPRGGRNGEKWDEAEEADTCQEESLKVCQVASPCVPTCPQGFPMIIVIINSGKTNMFHTNNPTMNFWDTFSNFEISDKQFGKF